ncbi:helix-turn-helix protein [Anatilimnocola aggregata]|uniref:Helix-turn-helix protein n=1 Tax=Anatilimnocola aggregata TaxID=2528021 RepID=A0A517Y5R9_9BACT|nr:helix-turn-helix transcriptional regulator [Anatilimnocola aggregata]QDU25584.1 helix-turn-helix protein [Anatilimnocola aggregata]
MSLEDQLRTAIKDSGQPGLAIAKATGVSQPAISRFLSGEDIRFSAASKLAEYFGLELRPVDQKAKKPAPKR